LKADEGYKFRGLEDEDDKPETRPVDSIIMVDRK